MTRITVLRPDEPELTAAALAPAPRAPLPERPVIGLIVNGKPLARELLQLLAGELGRRLGRRVDMRVLEKPAASQVLTAEEADAMAAQAHVVISGLGDCGSCSSCSLQDAVMIEQRGRPATVLITEPFQSLVASHAVKLGAPGYHALTIPHPVWGKGEEELRTLVRAVGGMALAQLAGRPG